MKPTRTSIGDPRRCENCMYFYQHYVMIDNSGKYIKCSAGHCGYPRCKNVYVHQTCGLFKEKPQEKP